jgi:hypothetical protein
MMDLIGALKRVIETPHEMSCLRRQPPANR